MHEKKFKRKGKENTSAVSLGKKLYTQFTLNYDLDKVRETVKATGECMPLRQVSSPEQTLAKKFIAPSYLNTTRPVCGLFYQKIHDHRFTITGIRKNT